MKKKLIISIISAVLCITLMLASSWALFSDKEVGNVSGKAGTVNIGLDCFTLGNPGNINPGDGDDNPPGSTPGTPHPIDFTVTNSGNKSIRTRVTLILTAEKPTGTLIDPLVFSIWNRGTDNKPTTEAVVKYIVTASQPNGVLASSYVPATHGPARAIKYILPETILNGTGTAAEIETGITTNSLVGRYELVLDRLADNFYQGCDLNIQLIAEAMQYRNTTTNDWTMISTQDIVTATGNVKGVPSVNQRADGSSF